MFHPIIGALIDAHWNGEMIDNIPEYSAGDYQFALIIIPLFLALSGLILFFMKETHPDHVVPEEYGPVIDTGVL